MLLLSGFRFLVACHRILLVLALYLIGVLVCYIASLGAKTRGQNGPVPLSRPRRLFATYLSALVSRAILFVFGFYWIKVKGRPSYNVRLQAVSGEQESGANTHAVFQCGFHEINLWP